MQVVNLIQGTPEWQQFRIAKFNASEASAIMGTSKYMSRQELLDLKATGAVREVSAFQQQLFDKGHDAEAKARPIIEKLIGEELYPVVATSDKHPELSASFDGITLAEDIIFEHKLWNKTLAEQVNTGNLDPHYYWQLEHQLLVSEADKAIFTVSDGTEEKLVRMEYCSLPERRQQLLTGWQLFRQDLDNYTVTNEVIIHEKPAETLPALLIELSGSVLATNIDAFSAKITSSVSKMQTDLATDQDFADAEVNIKFCEKAEKTIELVKQQALSKISDISAAFDELDKLISLMRDKRLSLTKLVKTKKDEIRTKVINDTLKDFRQHVDGLNANLKLVALPHIPISVAEAIKGKKSLSSLESAAKCALVEAISMANQIYERIKVNLEKIEALTEPEKALFSDLPQLADKDPDDFNNAVSIRLKEFKNIVAASPTPTNLKPAKQPSVNATVIDLINFGLTEDLANKLVIAIHAGEIRNLTITL